MKTLRNSLMTWAMLSVAVIVAQAEQTRGTGLSDRFKADSFQGGVDGSDAAARAGGMLQGQLIAANGQSRITAYLVDSGGKGRLLMIADLMPAGSEQISRATGNVFGYLYAAGQPDPHKVKSKLIVIGSYFQQGSRGSFDLVILDRRAAGQTEHVQVLGKIQGRFGQGGQVSMLSLEPDTRLDARGRDKARRDKAAGEPGTDPNDEAPLPTDSRPGRDSKERDRADDDGDDASDQATGSDAVVVFAAAVNGRWEIN